MTGVVACICPLQVRSDLESRAGGFFGKSFRSWMSEVIAIEYD